MNSPAQNSATSAEPRRRRRWPWIVAILVAPFIIGAAGVANYVTLDRDASVLRRHVMNATNSEWATKVQVSVGRGTITTVRAGLSLVDKQDIEDARGALRAIKCASVGVYERVSDEANWSSTALLAETDAVMTKRGWTRLVGVAGNEETVMVYVPTKFADDKPIDVALAVIDGRDLVVASATIDPDSLGQLIEGRAGKRFEGKLREVAQR